MQRAEGSSAPAPISADAVLVRADELTVHLSHDDEVRIELEGETVIAPKVAVLVLDAFAQPRAIGDALASLGREGPEHFIEASSVVLLLAREGILHPPGARPTTRARGYVRPGIHIAMLDDHARTRAFCDAIRAVVRAADVVVDIGTGTGVLAATAAKAGAQRVYAVESTAIADVAARVFETNGVADRITLVRARSTHATLPEKATVLVTEMIGNDPLDEHMLEIVDDARRRLLAPGARIIPSTLELYAVPLDVPRAFAERHAFSEARLQAYHADYGIDFSPLAAHRPHETQSIMIKTADVRAWAAAGPPVLLGSIDLESDFEVAWHADVVLAIARDVNQLGVILAFRATLAPGVTLSTLPADVDPMNHWRYPLWLSHDRPHAERGARVAIAYAYARGTSSLRFGGPSGTRGR